MPYITGIIFCGPSAGFHLCRTCAQVESQRKNNRVLHLPGGGTVPYNKDAPDLRMDLAGIAGRCGPVRKCATPYVHARL